MERNLDRRIEALVPVSDPELRARLLEILDLVFRDDTNAWASAATAVASAAARRASAPRRRCASWPSSGPDGAGTPSPPGRGHALLRRRPRAGGAAGLGDGPSAGLAAGGPGPATLGRGARSRSRPPRPGWAARS